MCITEVKSQGANNLMVAIGEHEDADADEDDVAGAPPDVVVLLCAS